MNYLSGLTSPKSLVALAIFAQITCGILISTVDAQEEGRLSEMMEETVSFEEEPVLESSSGVEFGAELFLSVASKYIWRGYEINEKPVFQGDFSVSAGNDAMGSFTAGVWGNMDLRNEFDNAGEFTEVDVYGDYSKSFGMVGVSAGVIYYHFPNSDLAGTTEVYGAVGLDTILEPTITVYYDIDEVEGFYATLGVGHGVDINDELSASFGLTAGYMDDDQASAYYGVSDGGFSNVDLSAELAYAFTDNIGASLAVVGTVVPDGDMRDEVDDPDNVYGIAGLSFSF